MESLDVLGYLAGLCYAFSGAPQAVKAVKEGHSEGVATSLIWMVWTGSALMLIYVLGKHGVDWPLLFDYLVTLVVWGTVGRYKYFPRSKV